MAPVLVTVSPYWISLDYHGKIPVITEDDNTDIISLQVEGHTSDSRSELDHLTCLDFVKSNNSGNTVTDADDSTKLLDIILNKMARLQLG